LLVAGAPATIPPGSLPDFTKWGEVERKPMSNIRRKTAEHLSSAWNQIPHVTQHDKADITSVEELRKKYASQAEKAGGKLTMTAIALKIAATAFASDSRSSTRRPMWRATRSSTASTCTLASPRTRPGGCSCR
jgi:pyruvate/2-oxoglutarate dehydrogenase complex dihydrolipoamide acyltransferase (E2) component